MQLSGGSSPEAAQQSALVLHVSSTLAQVSTSDDLPAFHGLEIIFEILAVTTTAVRLVSGGWAFFGSRRMRRRVVAVPATCRRMEGGCGVSR